MRKITLERDCGYCGKPWKSIFDLDKVPIPSDDLIRCFFHSEACGRLIAKVEEKEEVISLCPDCRKKIDDRIEAFKASIIQESALFKVENKKA